MKKMLLFALGLVFMLQLQNCKTIAPGSDDTSWKAQEVEEEVKYKFLKDKYDATYDASFETVFNSVLESIEDINCMIMVKTPEQDEETGLFRGKIVSDYCIFAVGDTTEEVLKYYSIDVPFIRGGNWSNGRMRYTFNLKEQEDGTVYLLLEGEISGFEKHATNKVHFWKSNGYFETKMMERIDEKVKTKIE